MGPPYGATELRKQSRNLIFGEIRLQTSACIKMNRVSIYECAESVVRMCSEKKAQSWTKHTENFSGFGIAHFHNN